MTVNRCVEQGIYVVLILSLQKDHRPLRSSELSDMLSVSDSYLKKVLRRLVLAGSEANHGASSRGKVQSFEYLVVHISFNFQCSIFNNQ